MQTAQKLLLETELSVAEIAYQVGYENPNKFSTAFKSVYEMTPTQFRNSIKRQEKCVFKNVDIVCSNIMIEWNIFYSERKEAVVEIYL